MADGGDGRSPAEHQRKRAGHKAFDATNGVDEQQEAGPSRRTCCVGSAYTAGPLRGSVLDARQDLSNPQDAINSISRSAQQAIASASQSAQQAIQQASDQVRQAQDQVRQATDAANRATSSANNAVNQAQASARQGIADAQNAASASASRQIAANLASVTSSASTQLASQIASIQSSASSSAANAIASATSSASAAVQSAQQEAQSARNDAKLQVQQAQGAAVSVTQAALAVVGAIIGSSLLTILAFYLFTRYRRNKRKEQTGRGLRREISLPKQDSLVVTNGLNASNGYPQDVKHPISPTRPDTALTTASGVMGYAMSDFGGGAPNFSRATTFVSNTPPQTSGTGTLQREPSVTRKPIPVPPSPRKSPAFTLFPPKSRDPPPGIGGLPSNPAPSRERSSSVYSSASAAAAVAPPATTALANEKLDRVDEETDEFGEGSKNWLRRTQTVSPFGDLADSPTGRWTPTGRSSGQARLRVRGEGGSGPSSGLVWGPRNNGNA
ncbi:uncharacterized protein ColSpa_12821 [Colletotrichum spaethianum]|uniref:Uncharacterized protein n=1 Tax=Colletotrichum spaethianum TaxID=700344 RepID=A0AA37PHW2_9PEZI|nr:uncharacterized protein ColSpa_12821 [Colletotrichum spaethianum]GKT52640.1 hypothetical protein ColSpa_12821 [Colletotrichum spaethianum]